jgi:hypothetical protein
MGAGPNVLGSGSGTAVPTSEGSLAEMTETTECLHGVEVTHITDPCPQEDQYDERGCYELRSTSNVGLELLTMPTTGDLRQDWCTPALW